MSFIRDRRLRVSWPAIGTLVAFAGSRTGVIALTSVGNLVVRTGSSMILTRLLKPYDFGIVGIITTVFFAVTMITDLGFEAFVIRHNRDDRHFRDVIWTIHAQRGFGLFVVVVISSPVIAWALGKPVVAFPLAVASVTFFINGLASLSLITALRNDKSRQVSLLDFGLQLLSTTAGVLLALWLRNAWAIIFVMIVQSSARAVLSYVIFPDSAQRLCRDRAIAREFLAFSRIVLMSSTLSLLIAQTDKVVLARIFTLEQFGLYAIALTIAAAPAMFGDSYVRRIVFPIYAQTWRQAPAEIASLYYRVKRIPAALYAFACGGLIGGAPLLMRLLYDPRYASASIFLSLLTISSALRLPNLAAVELMAAMNHMMQTVRLNIVRVAWLALTIPIGFAAFGTLGVVIAVGLVEVPAMLFCWILLYRVSVLRMSEELFFIALIVVGAIIGTLISRQVLWLFPYL